MQSFVIGSSRYHLIYRGGEELKVIPTSKLIYVQRKNQTVDAYFNTARGGKGSKETAVLTFEFEDGIECNAFCDSMKVLFGIPVRSFGLRKVDACVIGEAGTLLTEAEEEDGNSESSSEPVKTRTAKQKKRTGVGSSRLGGCPIHGNTACHCNIQKPVLSQLKGAEQSSDESPTEAKYSDKYPIAIEGKCEIGNDLRYKDISVVGRRMPGRVIEWFVSDKPGKDTSFPAEPVKSGAVFQPSDSTVGYIVKVRVARRVEGNTPNPFVYSVATKGPVTVNDVTARSMLEFITQTAVPIDITCSPTAAVYLFNLRKKQVPTKRPFFEGRLWVLRQGIVVRVEVGEELEKTLSWAEFYASRRCGEENDDPVEDLVLAIHLLGNDGTQRTCKLDLPSEKTRNVVFHTIAFYKLSKSFSGFDRWSRDLETGNFTGLKSRYAQLWATTEYATYASIRRPEILPSTPYDTSLAAQQPGQYEQQYAQPYAGGVQQEVYGGYPYNPADIRQQQQATGVYRPGAGSESSSEESSDDS
eukprot:GHVQ01007064.1.p1 GENE.GHVQ01007064.1~~GHVQ01007064.1.p1  ORF type:complete len:526 (+),score=65.90 GHVQ01007064.1:472-2049(+)